MIVADPYLRPKMGTSVSKPEEIIIAQNGANSASTSNLEASVKMYGSIMLAVLILCGIMFMYFCLQKCKSWSANWMQS